MVDVPTDTHASIDIKIPGERLEDCVAHEKIVFAVVTIVGSMEKDQMDALAEILDMRDGFAGRELCFLVYADAAWASYVTSMVRNDFMKNLKGAIRASVA